MDDEEHEVYGQEIPVDGEDVDMSAGDDATKVPLDAHSHPTPFPRRPNPSGGTDPSHAQLQELDEMKRRLKEMEEEAAALREMQAKVAKDMQGSEPFLPRLRSFGFVLVIRDLHLNSQEVLLRKTFALACSCLDS
jgi:polyadenylate-binding protein 2